MDIKLFPLFSLLIFVDTSTSTSSPSPAPITATPPIISSQENYLDSISIQDVISSNISANVKIDKNIVIALAQRVSNFDRSNEKFPFSNNSVTIDLGSENAIFYNFRIAKLPPSWRRKSFYSTLTGCNTTKIGTIEIKLLKDLEILADINVTQIKNSSSEFPSSPSDVSYRGFMNLTLQNISISKQLHTQADDSNTSTSKISYTKSTVFLHIAGKFRMPIYSKLEVVLDEIESTLGQFLIGKFNAEVVNNSTSVATNCLECINADNSSKTVNSNLYVIPNSKSETWKGVSFTAGPIIIAGLTSFNSAELTKIESEGSPPVPIHDDPPFREDSVKIATNDLKGKFDWNYNAKHKSTPFSIEFIQFEVKEYVRKLRDHEMYVVDRYKITRDLNFGDVQIDSSKSNVCENEREFVNYVLSEYLKTIIADSFKNTISKSKKI